MRPNFNYLAEKYASERNDFAEPFKGFAQCRMEDAFIAGVKTYESYLLKNHQQILK